MLANTLTFDFAGSNIVLSRIREQGSTSTYRYRDSAGVIYVTIKQTSYEDKSRGVTVKRHAVDMTHTSVPIAPVTVPTVTKAYTVIENDDVFDLAFTKTLVSSVADFLKVAGNVEPIIGEEY